VAALQELGEQPHDLRAAIGPAIGGCCYEVPADLHDEVGTQQPAAIATTTWGTPSLDLPAAVDAQLRRSGVDTVSRLETCTRCDPEARWFSHRRDAQSGRQVGIVVRRPHADRAPQGVPQ
jgi:polyphenol oxidase